MSFLSCAKIQRLTDTDVASRVLNADTLYIVLQVHFYREVLFGKDLRMCYFTREAKPNPMIRIITPYAETQHVRRLQIMRNTNNK